jgi:2-oxoglutarate dehydrogenase E2 component (dihydrolipoamide succinyltransferase)
MLTTFNEIDLLHVMNIRDKYKESFTKKYGVKLGFMPFFIKASVSALQVYPSLNSYLEGEEIIDRHYYDIGIAVATEKGLIVPVLRECDQLTFAQIEQKMDQFAKQAREGSLKVNDLQGGGFTITNGGVFGSLLSTPILNPPQCGILGMHKIEKRPVVIDDQIIIRPMMYVALSYDHRLIDGKEAVSFLVHIKNMLEDPTRLLLEI